MKPAQITRALLWFNGAIGVLMFIGLLPDVGVSKAFVALVGCLVLGTLGGFIYLVPTYVAAERGHASTTAILALNILLGWTMLGWVAALVWALTKPAAAPRPVVEVQQPAPRPPSTVEQLEKLAALRDRGALSDEEFAEQKRRVLAG